MALGAVLVGTRYHVNTAIAVVLALGCGALWAVMLWHIRKQ
jgi:hypothetical protein